jgi:iron complex outermembrane receptor protein
VTTTSSGIGVSANIANYVDGYYRPFMLGNEFDFFDISSVEVLAGPQGTLFGQNATGGAIIVTTRDPSFTPQGDLTASYGNYNDTRGSLYVTTGLGDKLAVSLGLYGRSTEGFSHDIVTGARLGDVNDWSIRNKWLFKPTDKVEFVLSLEHDNIRDNSSLDLNVYNGETSGASVPGTIIPTQIGQISSNVDGLVHQIIDAAFLTTKIDLDWAKLTSYTGFQQVNTAQQQNDLDGTRAPIFAVRYPEMDDAISQEFDLASEGNGRLNWVAGLYFMNSYGSQIIYAPVTPFIDTRYKYFDYAAFLDATYKVTPQLSLTLGARFTADDVGGSFQAEFAPISGEPRRTFTAFTPRGVIKYAITPDSNVYASVSQGFKSGLFNLSGLSTTPVQPEKITAYELGYKIDTGPLQFQAATYYYDYSNLQVSSFVNMVTQLINAAKATIYGADGHLSYTVNDNWRFDVGAAYTHGRYDSFPGAPYFSFDPTTGIFSSIGMNAAGHATIHTPDFSGNISVDYHHRLFGGTVQLVGNYSYTTSMADDAFGNFIQPAYGILNLRAAWTTPDNRWTFSLYGRNVTNTRYLEEIILSQGALQQWGWPVSYGAEVSTKF